MFQQQAYIINTFRMALDAICIILAGYLAFFLNAVFFFIESAEPLSTTTFTASVLLVMFTNNYAMARFDLYNDLRPSTTLSILWTVVKTIIVDFAVLAAAVYLLHMEDFSRDFMVLFTVLSLSFIAAQKILFESYIHKLSRKAFNTRKILVVGNMERGQMVTELLAKQLSWGHEIIGRLTTDSADYGSDKAIGTIDDLPKVIRDQPIDEVIFAIDGDRAINLAPYLQNCRQIGVPARILPALWRAGDHALAVDQCQGVPFLTIPVGNLNATGLLYKRMLDIVGGLLGFLLFCLIFPVIALAIKLDSPGPVFFKQRRIGQHGRSFFLYKFRTMCVDAEERKQDLMARNEMQGAMFKLADDPRVTKVGKFLRKTSLDEFPQFLNVLKGQMSLVGTRPPTLQEVDEYQTWHYKRLSGRPGITGLWQISGRNKITDFNEIVKLDCQYLDKWRFSDDLKILFTTAYVVLRRKGAV